MFNWINWTLLESSHKGIIMQYCKFPSWGVGLSPLHQMEPPKGYHIIWPPTHSYLNIVILVTLVEKGHRLPSKPPLKLRDQIRMWPRISSRQTIWLFSCCIGMNIYLNLGWILFKSWFQMTMIKLVCHIHYFPSQFSYCYSVIWTCLCRMRLLFSLCLVKTIFIWKIKVLTIPSN